MYSSLQILISAVPVIVIISVTLFLITTLPVFNSFNNFYFIGDNLPNSSSSSLILSNSSLSAIIIDMIDLGSETVKVFKSSFLPETIHKPLKPVFTYQMKGLPMQNYSNYAINYLGGDEPLYLLEGSVLNYSLKIIHDNSTNCPVRLDIFDDICNNLVLRVLIAFHCCWTRLAGTSLTSLEASRIHFCIIISNHFCQYSVS